jgi:hypothetical protein
VARPIPLDAPTITATFDLSMYQDYASVRSAVKAVAFRQITG